MKELLHRNMGKLAAAAASSAWAIPMVAAAQTISTPGQVARGPFRDFESTIQNAFNIVIIIAGIVFVVLFLLGGVQYLTSAGNEEATKKARQLMLDAVIGLVIVVTAWAVGTYVLGLLGIGTGTGLETQPIGN